MANISPGKNGQKGSGRPNIVYICSDQHSYRYAGYAGHPFVKTPNLDRIASYGAVFNHAYSNQPVCVPGRSAMMTGVYASDCNSFCNSTVWDGSHPTWGKRLKEAGYYTRAHGKMDLNDAIDTGFEEIGTNHGHRHHPDITSLFRQPVCYRVDERPQVNGQARPERFSADVKVAEQALDFLNGRAVESPQPWVLYAGFLEPHPPYNALENYFKMYYPNRVDMPNIPPDYLENQHLVLQELRSFKRIATPIPESRIRRARAAYFGLISELDEYVGRIWDALEKSGQLENTVFIYTSDHGEMLGEHGLWYKNTLLENAVRVPLIMAGAGIPQGIRIDTPVSHVDVAATIVELAGIDQVDDLRGHSLLPLIQGDQGKAPAFVYSETHSEGNCTGSFMIRRGDWKYIHFTYYSDLLFNLKDDPCEFTNRINDPSAKEVLAELKQILLGEVNPGEVTQRAFRAQEGMLQDFARRMPEKELAQMFTGRLGKGQAAILAAKAKES